MSKIFKIDISPDLESELKINKKMVEVYKPTNIMHNHFTSSIENIFIDFSNERFDSGRLINKTQYKKDQLTLIELNDLTKNSHFSKENTIEKIEVEEREHKNIKEEKIAIQYNNEIPQIKSDTEFIRIFKSLTKNPNITITTNFKFKNFNDNQSKIITKIFEFAQRNSQTNISRMKIKIKDLCQTFGLQDTALNKRKLYYDFTNLSNMEINYQYKTTKGKEIKLRTPLFAILGTIEVDRIPQYISIQFGDWFENLKLIEEMQTYKKVNPDNYKFLSKHQINHAYRLIMHITSLHRNRIYKKDKSVSVSFLKIMELFNWSEKEIHNRISEKAEFLEKILNEIKNKLHIDYKWKKPTNTKILIEIYKQSVITFDCLELDKNYI